MSTYHSSATISVRGAISDLLLEIDYDFTRASKGARDSLGGVRGAGPPLEPDEPAHCTVTEVRAWPDPEQGKDQPGADITALLAPDQIAILEELCLENHDD